MTNKPKLDELQKLLNKPLHPGLIERREGGRGEPYISTTTAITQANRIIGALNWYIEVIDHRLVKNDVEPIGYQCTVRIHIPSCDFQGEGIGFNALTTRDGKLLQTPESHDTAIKGAESDAVKRALRYLGDPFANFLYEDPAVRRAMANAAIPVVARRLNIDTQAAESLVRRPYSKLEDVPVNTSMGHYYGRDVKPNEHAEPVEDDATGGTDTHQPTHASPEEDHNHIPNDTPPPPDQTQENNTQEAGTQEAGTQQANAQQASPQEATQSDPAPQESAPPAQTTATTPGDSPPPSAQEHNDLDDEPDPFSPV